MSKDTQKAFDKIQHPSNCEFLQPEKGNYKSLQLTLNTKCFLPRSTTRQECLLYPHIHHRNRGPDSIERQENEIKAM